MEEVAIIILWGVLQCFTPCGYDAKNTSKLESNLDDLDKEMKSLIDLRSQVQRRVESSDEKQDTTKAEEWLEKAEQLEKSANSIRERVAGREKGRAQTAYSEWKWKSGASREVVGLLEKVKRLKKDDCFEN